MRKLYRFIALSLCAISLLGLYGCGCKHEWQDATCTEPKTCSKCGETQTRSVDALGHDYVDDECTRCHDVIIQTSADFEYAYDSVRDAYYVKAYKGSDAVVTVDEKYNDGVHGTKSVMGIGDGAFIYNTTLTTVVLPDSIVWIGNSAFCGCENLVSINLGASVEIGANAFDGTMVYY